MQTKVWNRFPSLCNLEFPNAFRNKKKVGAEDFNTFEKVFKTEVQKFDPGKIF